MGIITVVNKRTFKGTGEYIGRGSPLGNDWSHLPLEKTKAKYKTETIEEAIQCYANDLDKKLAAKDPSVCSEMNRLYRLAKGGDLFLVCHCITKKNPHCHGNVIKLKLEEAIMANQEKKETAEAAKLSVETPQRDPNKPIRIALIGSRDLEKDYKYALEIPRLQKVCYRLAELGVTMTSGLCALGMDAIAQKQYALAISHGKATPEQLEVYVADQSNIDKSNLPYRSHAIIRNPDMIPQTHALCLEVMGESHWNNCGPYAKGMHSRNCHQIFGYNLDNPVDAVVTWTPNGNVQGGTATALKLAMKAGIPIYNFGHHDKQAVMLALKDFLERMGVYSA